jgi:preprotein translocase subunit SecD
LLANVVAVSIAEPAVIEVVSAQAAHDQRTGKPVLNLKLGGVSNKEFMDLFSRRLGKTSDFRVNGRVVASPVVREPMLSPNIQISGGDWTEETVRKIVEECAQPGAKCEVVIPNAD